MAKAYAIISGKGGVGKTSTAINLGYALNILGEDVTIIDANISTPNIGIHLGSPIVPITLNNVLNNSAKLVDAIYEHDSGTKIIPASISLKDSEKINLNKLKNIIKELKKLTNHIIIDSAAGLGLEARSAINASDELIIVTNPEMSAVTDALKTIKLAEIYKKPIKGIIITRNTGKRHEMSLENIKEMLESEILGIIPEDVSIKESQVIKTPVIQSHPKSNATKHYMHTSKKFLDNNIPLKKPNKNIIKLIFGK